MFLPEVVVMPAPRRVRCARLALLAPVCALAAAACGPASPPALRIGAVFPLSGSAAAAAHDEYGGAQLAAAMVNGEGGAGGRHIDLDVRSVTSVSGVQQAADSLRSDGVPAVIGAYSSALSIPLAAAVARDGMVYWETGAVADQVTGRGSPLVFRVGADGADLGGNSGRFVAQQIAPRLGVTPSALSAFLVTVDDAYGHSVAGGARTALESGGVRVAGEAVYDPNAPQFAPVLAAVSAAKPQILVLSSHVNDGIAFRRAFLADHIYVDAFMGTTMAQCYPEFGAALGPDAVGVFASDRPEADFNPGALNSSALAVYRSFAAAWTRSTGRAPTEEALAGFSSAWVLFHDVLTRAATSAGGIAGAARSLDLPPGSVPNGAGVRFGQTPADLGQNLRAASVIWQWQAVRHSVVVWPSAYATGTVTMVPLPA
ncbi:MAG TPA: ABC transporter substrate-binding protein [Candidatus Dormibacteraeota bacterium]